MTSKTSLAISLGRKTAGGYGRPNKFITWYCDRHNRSGAWLTAAWCAMWASWTYSAAGLGSAVGGSWAYCPSWVNWFKRKGRWGSTPRVGAVVFYDWNNDGVADHVGIVTKVGKTSIKSLEGNTRRGSARNQVYEQTRKASTVLGYGYVDDEPARRTYTVRQGDSLSRIAKTYDTTWQKLYAKNKAVIGSKASLIRPGMVLVVD